MLALTVGCSAPAADRDEHTILPTPAIWSQEARDGHLGDGLDDGGVVVHDNVRGPVLAVLPGTEAALPGDTGEVAAAGADVSIGARGAMDGLNVSGVALPADREQRIKDLFGVGSPLNPYADLFVQRADSLGIDWRLAPAIAVWESGAGRHACGGNAYGIGSCGAAYRYESWEAGVEAVTALLASPMYQGLTTGQILRRWVSGNSECHSEHCEAYAGRVMGSMEGMGER